MIDPWSQISILWRKLSKPGGRERDRRNGRREARAPGSASGAQDIDGRLTPRPRGQLLAFLLLVWTGLALLNGVTLYRNGALVEPVTVSVEGLGQISSPLVTVSYKAWKNRIHEFWQEPGPAVWRVEQSQVKKLWLRVAPQAVPQIETVRVEIGARQFAFSQRELLAEWRRVKAVRMGPNSEAEQFLVLEAPPGVRAGGSRISRLAELTNWPGDGAALRRCIVSPLLLTGFLTAAILLTRRVVRKQSWREGLFRLLGATPRAGAPASSEAALSWREGWFAAGAGMLVVSLAYLEWMQPFYFTQNDNFAQFLPVTVWACRSLEGGVFPVWNPYQFLGAPTASMGVYALTYPPTYLAYFAARYLLGNEYLTLELFTLAHLLVGYLVTYPLGRRLGLRPSLAALCSLCFLLSGYSLIAGRSWYYHVPLVVWLPLLVGASVRLGQGRGTWQWVAGTGCVIGAFFHAGNAQMWAYGLLLVGVGVLVQAGTGVLPARRALWWGPALLLGLAIAAPLLLPQRLETGGIDRARGTDYSIAPGMLAMLAPFPLARAPHGGLYGSSDHELMGQFYYSGTLFVAAGWIASLALLGMLTGYRLHGGLLRRLVGENLWLVCAGVALLFALGNRGVLWMALRQLPVFSQFNDPFKFLPFVNLFLVVGGGLIVNRALARSVNSRRWELGIGLSVLALLMYHVSLARPSFYSFRDTPFPSLAGPITDTVGTAGRQEPYRLQSFAGRLSADTGYVSSLIHNFPTLIGALSVFGYDPLVEATTEYQQLLHLYESAPVQTAREYGVRWITVHRTVEDPGYGANPRWWRTEREGKADRLLRQALTRAAARRLEHGGTVLWELSGSRPLAFLTARPDNPLPISLNGAGATVSGPELARGGSLVVNVLWRPRIRVSVDGRELPCRADSWGRVLVTAPPGAARLEVRYAPPWGSGWLLGTALAAVAAAITLWIERTNRGRAWRGAEEEQDDDHPSLVAA